MSASVDPVDPVETVRWTGRPRFATVVPEAVIGLGLAAGLLVMAVVSSESWILLLAPVGLAVPVWKLLVVTNTAFLVTDRAIYRKTGILARNVRRIGLERVQDSAYRQGIRGTLFGYGTVVVEAAGGGQIRFTAVKDPQAVRSLVGRRSGAATVPGRVEIWESVLAEVRAIRRAIVDR